MAYRNLLRYMALIPAPVCAVSPTTVRPPPAPQRAVPIVCDRFSLNLNPSRSPYGIDFAPAHGVEYWRTVGWKFHPERSLILTIALAGLASTLASGCSRFSRQASAQEIARGHILFEAHCLGCHGGKILTLARRPPSLNGIFQRKYLPSGAPATDGQVKATIEDGRAGIMPPFRDILSNRDIRDIIAYLHTVKVSAASETGRRASGT